MIIRKYSDQDMEAIAEAEKGYMPLGDRIQQQTEAWLKSRSDENTKRSTANIGNTVVPEGDAVTELYREWDEGRITEEEFREKVKKIEEEAFSD